MNVGVRSYTPTSTASAPSSLSPQSAAITKQPRTDWTERTGGHRGRHVGSDRGQCNCDIYIDKYGKLCQILPGISQTKA